MSSSTRRRRAQHAWVVLYFLVLFTCVRAWVGPAPGDNSALAQIPNAGAQRATLVDELRRTNELLAEIKQVLTAHTFNVRIEGADNPGTDNRVSG